MRPYRSLCVHIDFMRIHSLLYGTVITAQGILDKLHFITSFYELNSGHEYPTSMLACS